RENGAGRNLLTRFGGLHLQLGREVECAARLSFSGVGVNPGTFDPYSAMHEFHQLGGDGKPKTGATVLSSEGVVGLFERYKDELLFFRRNADSGIRDSEMELDGLFCSLLG